MLVPTNPSAVPTMTDGITAFNRNRNAITLTALIFPLVNGLPLLKILKKITAATISITAAIRSET